MTNQLQTLQKRIDYNFQDIALLELALTHRSVSGRTNNERLEFLGDSILNHVIAEALFHKFPQAKEGQMSRLRASLVKGETLAEIAKSWNLGEYLKLGAGEMKSGGHRRDSTLADAVEAIMGGVLLDQGHDKARAMILQWYQVRLDALELETVAKDPKTRLQEFLQSRRKPLPVYTVESVSGDPHNQTFQVRCDVSGLTAPPGFGSGSSRRGAEQAAAREVLNHLPTGGKK